MTSGLELYAAFERGRAKERAAVVAYLYERAEAIRKGEYEPANREGALELAAREIELGIDGVRNREPAPPPERSCFTCRWADGIACDRPHTSEAMDADIDAYAVAAGCHYNNGGMPTDRTVACPGHEPKDPEGCAHVVEPFRVDPDGTVVGRCALCGDNTFVIREGGADTVGQFAIWTEHVTAPNRMPEPNTSLEGMISSEIGEVKAGTWLLSSGNGATHWRLHSLYPSFEDAYAAHRNLLSGVNR